MGEGSNSGSHEGEGLWTYQTVCSGHDMSSELEFMNICVVSVW